MAIPTSYYVVKSAGFSPVQEDESFLWITPAEIEENYVVGTDAFTSVSDALFAGTRDLYVFAGTYTSNNLTLATGRILNLSSDNFNISTEAPYTATTSSGGTNTFSVKNFTNAGTVNVGSGVAFNYGDKLATVTNTGTFNIAGGATVKADFSGGTINLSGTLGAGNNIKGDAAIAAAATIYISNGAVVSGTSLSLGDKSYLIGATLDVDSLITNGKTLYVQGGSTIKVGGIVGTGTITLQNNSSLTNSKVTTGSVQMKKDGNSVNLYGVNDFGTFKLQSGKDASNLQVLTINGNGLVVNEFKDQLAVGSLSAGSYSQINVNSADLTANYLLLNKKTAFVYVNGVSTIAINDLEGSGDIVFNDGATVVGADIHDINGDTEFTGQIKTAGNVTFKGVTYLDSLYNKNNTITITGGENAKLTTNKGITGTGSRITIDTTGFDDESYHIVYGGLSAGTVTAAGYTAVTKMLGDEANTGVWLSKSGQNTIYVDSAYAEKEYGTIFNHYIVGYNAFGSLADLTFEGPKDGTFVTSEGVTVVTAPTISLAAGTVATYAQPAFFFANNSGVTFVGKDGTAAAKTAVTISNTYESPLYLMGAVTVENEAGYWGAMQAASGTDYAGAQKFTIDESLALTVADLRVGLPLNYDDFNDDTTKTPKRQAAVGNLTINGKVTTATWLVAGPLSKISVGATGSVVSENRTVINAGSTLDVLGSAAVKTAEGYQFTGGDLQFINGSSTAKFTSSKVKLAKTDGVFMLDGWTKNKEYATVNANPVEVTFDGTILDITGSNKFFNYNVTADVDNKITNLPALNLTFKNGSVATATGAILNVGAKVDLGTKTDVTVNIGLAEGDTGSNSVSVKSVSNYGTINVNNDSTLTTVGALSNAAEGTINVNGAAVTANGGLNNSGTFIITDATVTVNGSQFNNHKTLTITNSTITVDGNYGLMTWTSNSNVNVYASTINGPLNLTNGGVFTIGEGTSTLNGTLLGTIKLDGATLKNSTVGKLYGASNIGTFSIAAGKTAAFEGTNSLNANINNNGTITVNAGSSISATSINGGTIELVGTPVSGDIVVTAENGLASAFEWKYGEGATDKVYFAADEKDVSKQHGQYWFTKTANKISVSQINTDDSTLIVKEAYKGQSGPVEFHGKYYMIDYNAFWTLADITFEGPKDGTFVDSEGVKPVTANSITFAAGEAAVYTQPAFLFGSNANGITFYGENGLAATEVTISNTYESPLYLMGAVTVENEAGYWDAMQAASGTDYAGAQKFTIAQGLDLTVADLRVGLPLNYDDFDDTTKEPKRQAAVGNLTINGKVTTATWLVAGPLSKISVGATGSVVSENRTVINAGSTLDVLGSAAVKTAEGYQFTGGDLQFINGSSTAKFTSSKVKLAKTDGVFMLDGWTKNKEYATVNANPVEVTFDGTILDITGSNKFFNYNVTADVDNKITNLPALNLTFKNGSVATATGADLNVGAKDDSGTKTDVTVNVLSNSSLSVASVTNYGTVNVGNAADTDNNIDPTTGTLTATGAITNKAGGMIYAFGASTINASEIANSGTVTITGTAGKKDAIVNAVIKNDAGGTVSLTNAVVSKNLNAYNRGSVIADNSNVTFYKLDNDSYGSVFQATDSNIATYSDDYGDITNAGTFTVTRGSITAKHDLVNNAPGSWGVTKFEATDTTISAQTLNNKGPFSAVNSKITASTAIKNSGTFEFNKGANASETKNAIETNSINNSGTFEAVNAAITGTTVGELGPALDNTGIFVLDNSSLTMDVVNAGAGTTENKFTVGGASTLTIKNSFVGTINVANGANLTANIAVLDPEDVSILVFDAAVGDATASITIADGSSIAADIVNNNANLTVNGTVTTDAITNGTKVGTITTAGTITVNGDLTAGDIMNAYGTIKIDATDSISATKIAGGSIVLDTTTLAKLTIDTNNDEVPDKAPAIITLISGLSSNMSAKVYANSVAEANLIKSGDIITLGSGDDAQQYRVSGGSGSKAMTLYSVDDQPQDKLYVKSTYNDTTAAQEGLVFGYNAFANLATALNIAKDADVVDDGDETTTEKIEVFLGGTKDTSITNQTDNLFFGKVFKNDTVIKLGQKEGDAPAARTATIGFKATDANEGDVGLFLNPAAGKNITIDSGVTIKTTATNNTNMGGTVYLNYAATTGTVTVKGNIVSASDIYILGTATVTGNLTVDDTIGQLLLRSGKANVAAADGEDQVNKAVTIGRTSRANNDPAQVSGKWIVLVSGDAVFNNTVITIGALGYDNYKTKATAHEYDVDPSLTSTNTVWTIGQLRLDNEIHSEEPSDATFTFNGGSVGVTYEAELSGYITMNLDNSADLTIGGALTNKGTIGTTGSAATADISAASISNTNSITAVDITATTGDLSNTGSITAANITATAGSITNDGSITATGIVTAGGDLANNGTSASISAAGISAANISNTGSITATAVTATTGALSNTGSITAANITATAGSITNDGSISATGTVSGATGITNNGTFTATGASVTGTIANNGTFTANGATLGSITNDAGTNANASLTFEGAKSTAAYIKNRGGTVTIGADLEVAGTFETAALSGKPSVSELQEGKTLTANLLLNGATFNATDATIDAAIKNSGTINATRTTLVKGITNSTTGAVFNAIDTALDGITISNSGTFTVKNSNKKLNVTVTDNAINLDNVQLTDANVVGGATVVSDSTLNGGAFTNLAIAEGSKLDVIDGKLTAGTVAATGTLTLKNNAAIDVTTSIDNLVLEGGLYTTADVTVDETTIPANLKIASLTGTITLAGTTLNNVTLASGTFDVAKVLDDEETVATSFTGVNSIGSLVVDEGAALTISAAATVADDSKVSLTVNGDFYNAGTITIDATDFEWGTSQKFIKVAAITGENITNIGTVTVTGIVSDKYHTMAIVKNDEQGKGIYLYKVDAVVDTKTLYVNKAWAGSHTGDSVEYVYEGGTVQCVFGVNAFADTANLVKYEDTEAIMVKKNALNYGAFTWDKAVNVTLNNGEPTFGAVTFGLVEDTTDDDTKTTINGGFTAASLSFGNDAEITGNVTTTGAAFFEEEAFIDGNLIATGDVTFEDEAEITGNVISNALIFQEDVEVGGNIAATGAVTLYEDTVVGGVLSASSLILTSTATLAMKWNSAQEATIAVSGEIDNNADNCITIDIFDKNSGLENVTTNKTVISAGSAVEYASLVANYDESYFSIVGNNLVLDAKKIAKVRKGATEDVSKGTYNSISKAVANTNTGLILIVEGNFSNACLNNKQTRVLTSGTVGATAATSASYVVGGCNVSKETAKTTAESPFAYVYPYYKEVGNYQDAHALASSLTIDSGVFNNAYVAGADLVMLKTDGTEDSKSLTFNRFGDSNLTINGGTFVAAPEGATGYAERAIAGGMLYNIAGGKGTASLHGDINLTITGGTFEGYNVYGGNYVLGLKSYGVYTSVYGDITLTLDASAMQDETVGAAGALNFKANAGGYGGIVQAGSFGPSPVYGSTQVVLTGGSFVTDDNNVAVKAIDFEQLIGGSGKHNSEEGEDMVYVEGDRILTFSDFTGTLDFYKIQDFNVVSFEGDNVIDNFSGNFSKFFDKDVTKWAFGDGATLSGNVNFDITGDTLDLTACNSDLTIYKANVTGFDETLANVVGKEKFAFEATDDAYVFTYQMA